MLLDSVLEMKKKGIIHGVHHPLFDIDNEALITGVKIMCAAAL